LQPPAYLTHSCRRPGFLLLPAPRSLGDEGAEEEEEEEEAPAPAPKKDKKKEKKKAVAEADSLFALLGGEGACSCSAAAVALLRGCCRRHAGMVSFLLLWAA